MKRKKAIHTCLRASGHQEHAYSHPVAQRPPTCHRLGDRTTSTEPAEDDSQKSYPTGSQDEVNGISDDESVDQEVERDSSVTLDNSDTETAILRGVSPDPVDSAHPHSATDGDEDAERTISTGSAEQPVLSTRLVARYPSSASCHDLLRIVTGFIAEGVKAGSGSSYVLPRRYFKPFAVVLAKLELCADETFSRQEAGYWESEYEELISDAKNAYVSKQKRYQKREFMIPIESAVETDMLTLSQPSTNMTASS